MLKRVPDVLFTIVVALLMSCGGGGGDANPLNDNANDSSSSGSVTISGVLVDPYIEGAILCEDVAPHNGQCDVGEQTSSRTDDNGVFTFSQALTPGSHIIVDAQGYHNGVPYTLDISGVVDDNGAIDVVSPLTALEARGLSTAQIATLFHSAGLNSISAEDIRANPLEGGIESLTDDNKLRRLHASLAAYGMLRTIEGSQRLSQLSGDELYQSTEVAQILQAMVGTITSALSTSVLDSIQGQADLFAQPNFNPPAVSVGVVASTAVTIIDALTKIAYDECNQTDGDDATKVANALAAFNAHKDGIIAQSQNVGIRHYAIENAAVFNAIPAQFQSLLPEEIRDTLASVDDAVIIDTSGATPRTALQSPDVSNVSVEAFADDNASASAVAELSCQASGGQDFPGVIEGSDCDADGYKVAYQTAAQFRVALKTLALVSADGQKHYLIQKDSLEESAVFDISEPKVLAYDSLPQGSYSGIYAEIYYYFLQISIDVGGDPELRAYRIYMSDDNPVAGDTLGYHQGDVVYVTSNNKTTLGWIAPGAPWRGTVTPRPEPDLENGQAKLYSADPDPVTGRQRGPFGGTDFWNDNSTANDVYFMQRDFATHLNVSEESEIQLKFSTRNNWYWEDFNDDGIFGPGVHIDPQDAGLEPDQQRKEAASIEGSWAPVLELPQVLVIE